MRTATTTTTAALVLIVATATHRVQGFAPLSPMVHTRTRTSTSPSVLARQMVMDKPDPMDVITIDTKKRQSTDPTPFFVSLFEKTDNKANMKMMAAAMAVALTVLPLPSYAAMSGGRMGGSFSAPRSMPRSRSMPSSSSYSRGSSYGGGYSRGYSSGGMYSRNSVIIAPPIVPMMSPGYGYGGGYGGAGVMSYSRGPSFFDLVILGGFMFAAVNVVRGAGGGTIAESVERSSSPFGSVWGDSSSTVSALGSGTSVVQLSVALEVPNRDDSNSILGVLNRLASTSKTDSRVGIQNLTSQVALELLRRRSSIVSASGSSKHFGDRNKAGREYQSRSVQERSKFEKESVSKYGGVDYGSEGGPSVGSLAGNGKATMAVVTLVLTIDGDSIKVPSINSVADVEEALRRVASDAKVDDCLQSAEILWTPEDRSETLSLRDVVADYPELRSV
jgi:uncharacterized membrane protein